VVGAASHNGMCVWRWGWWASCVRCQTGWAKTARQPAIPRSAHGTTGQTRAAVRLAQVAAFVSFYAGTAAMAVIGKWA
jgi:hypothetical protein